MNTRVTVYENATPRDKLVAYNVDGKRNVKTVRAGEVLKLPRSVVFELLSTTTIE